MQRVLVWFLVCFFSTACAVPLGPTGDEGDKVVNGDDAYIADHPCVIGHSDPQQLDPLVARLVRASRDVRLRAFVSFACVAWFALGCSGTIGDAEPPHDPSRPNRPETTGTIDVPRRLLLLEPRQVARSIELLAAAAEGAARV